MDTLKAAVIPSLSLEVGEKAYTVEFPLSALAMAETKVGRSLTSLNDWLQLRAVDIPYVLEAGLSRHHPQMKAEEVLAICDSINPEALDEVHYALCKLAFPKAMAKLEKVRSGAVSPNVEGGAAL